MEIQPSINKDTNQRKHGVTTETWLPTGRLCPVLNERIICEDERQLRNATEQQAASLRSRAFAAEEAKQQNSCCIHANVNDGGGGERTKLCKPASVNTQNYLHLLE